MVFTTLRHRSECSDTQHLDTEHIQNLDFNNVKLIELFQTLDIEQLYEIRQHFVCSAKTDIAL